MTFEIFMFLFTIGSLVSGLFTEAMKRLNNDFPANVTALFNAFIVGIFGTTIAYILMGITLTLPNIACIFLMGFCIWLGSMIGYDKVAQTIRQIKE